MAAYCSVFKFFYHAETTSVLAILKHRYGLKQTI